MEQVVYLFQILQTFFISFRVADSECVPNARKLFGLRIQNLTKFRCLN